MTLTAPQIRIGSLFTGTSALDLAAQAVFGGTHAWVSDTKPAAVALLAHHYPDVPNLGDLTHWWPAIGPLRREALDVAPIEILTAGWPCQPHSSAGKRLGEDDHRALWPNVARAIAELRPRIFLGENVARIAGNGELRRVVRSLAELGYVGTWRCVTASDAVKAPHRRGRCFVLAVRADVVLAGFDLGPRGTGAGLGATGGSARGRVTLLPTPTRSMTTGAGTSGREGGMNLQTAAVTLFPTPTARDGRRGAGWGDQPGRPLSETIQRVAPPAVGWGEYATAIGRWERVLGRPAPAPTQVSPRNGRSQLAPPFVEWMMGLPVGWVSEVEGLSSRTSSLRNARLSLLGDGVVPQQAEYAYRLGLAGLLGQHQAAA